MAHLLEVKELVTRFYTEAGVVHAVNGISYTLNEGESIAIVGESGSGKSVGVLSLMRLIPSPPGRIESGEVQYNGRDLLKVSDQEMRSIRGREIAMIFQDPMTSLNPVLTIGRQMTEGLKLHLGMNDAQAKRRSAEMLDLVGIPNAEDRLSDYPHQFSGGQRQRIMIAMALSCNPSILIADEPTTALDVTIQAQIVELVKELQEKLGMAIIWITHDLGVVAGMVQKSGGDVRRVHRRASGGQRPVPQADPPLHAGAARFHSQARRQRKDPLSLHQGAATRPVGSTEKLRVRAALPVCHRQMLAGEPAITGSGTEPCGSLLAVGRDPGRALLWGEDSGRSRVSGSGGGVMSEANGHEKEVLVQVKNLKKHFPILRGVFRRQVGAVQAVDGVIFDIYKGETLGLVGESGCGKSTTGRTILQLLEPTDGTGPFYEDPGPDRR